MDSYIQQKAEELRASDVINNKMWPCSLNVNGDDKKTFDAAITRMRTALKNRIDSLDKLIKAL